MKVHHLAIGAVVIDFIQWAIRQWLIGEAESMILKVLQVLWAQLQSLGQQRWQGYGYA